MNVNVPAPTAKRYSSYCEISFKKLSKCFFLSSVLRYYLSQTAETCNTGGVAQDPP